MTKRTRVVQIAGNGTYTPSFMKAGGRIVTAIITTDITVANRALLVDGQRVDPAVVAASQTSAALLAAGREAAIEPGRPVTIQNGVVGDAVDFTVEEDE